MLAEHGYATRVIEATDAPGGACRTAELTLPGFHHDVGAAVLPFARLSRFFRAPALAAEIDLVDPEAPVAHPLDGEDAVLLERSVGATAAGLGRDATRYRRAMAPLAARALGVLDDVLGPARPPRHPLVDAAFGAPALLPGAALARTWLRGHRGRALVAGLSAHATAPLTAPATASAALVMAMTAHAGGWPVARGGTATLVDALTTRLEGLGVAIDTGRRVGSMRDLPDARVVLLDLAPGAVASVCGDALPSAYRHRLARFTHGPGVFKLDWALRAPIPWRDPRCARAATVHLGGTLEEIAASEAAVAGGRHADRPFVILVQPTLADPTRAPAGAHTAWAYCHVPNGSTVDMTAAIEAQVERFAPGFPDVVAARSRLDTRALEAIDANLVGGDINGGRFGLVRQFLRPVARLDPYATPNPAIFLCGAATPPGGGVHGMCGWWAARTAMRRLRAA